MRGTLSISLASMKYLATLLTISVLTSGMPLSGAEAQTEAPAAIAAPVAPNDAVLVKTPKDTAEQVAKDALPTDIPQDIALGQPEAPLTMIEYTSLSCPHCADFHVRIMPQIYEKFVKTGKIKIIHRDYPLNAPALHGAMLTHCVEKDNYYNMLKILFSEQEKWAYSEDYREKLATYAGLSGLSREKFDTCLNDKALENRILNSRIYGTKAYNIQGTPAFIINGKAADIREIFLNTDEYLTKELETAEKAEVKSTKPVKK